jgi:hypothetical protein
MKLLPSTLSYVFIALLAISCVAPEAPVSIDDTVIKGKELVFSASFGDYQTKTAFQSDETSIWWSPGDAIKIYYGSASNGDVFTSSHTVEVAKAEFTGTLSAFTGVTGTGDFNYFWAVYPQTAGISCNGSSVVASLAGVQQAKAGSFTTNTNVTIAKSPGLALSFYNTCAWFRFTVTQEGVKTVRFRGNAGEYVAGQFRVSMDENGKPTAPEVIDGEGIQEIVLNAPEGQTLVVGAMYYITLLPQTFQEGFTVTFETESLVGRRSINSSSTYVRSKYNTGTNFDQNVEYTSKLTGNIEFADSNVKSICVANWDANSDGELSYEEAAAVTTIPYGVFSENTTITSFDEFQYFTSVTSLGYHGDYDEGMDYYGAFSYCSALTSIILPSSLHDISFGAFRGCSSLESITIPATVTRIGQVAFDGCTKLEVIMESATPCTLYPDSYETYPGETCAFGLSGNRVKAIYVPTEESVNTYKAATYWSTYSSIIKWIGERVPLVAAVDLGLTSGLKWASFNVGANAPEDYGEYFAWGETTTKTDYKGDWSNYFDPSFTKYNIYGKGLLDLENDAANANWGGSWRMPTDAEWKELSTECAWTWTTQNEKNGYLVTGPNGNSIFLPAAGNQDGTSLNFAGSYGFYWSSMLYVNDSHYARIVRFHFGEVERVYGARCHGRSVRPVTE